LPFQCAFGTLSARRLQVFSHLNADFALKTRPTAEASSPFFPRVEFKTVIGSLGSALFWWFSSREARAILDPKNEEARMLSELSVATKSRTSLVDITDEVRKVVRNSGVKQGVCHLYVPHTTAAVTINENADPSVRSDILMELNKLVPLEDNYSHLEGNAAAHIKSSIIGACQSVLITDGDLKLGTWQGLFFCEFDGPRKRRLFVKIVPDQ
jgi:secondary thiamine-phosphate synthase enzyme